MNKKENASQYHSNTIQKDIKRSSNKPLFKHGEIKMSDVECSLLCYHFETGERA